MALLNLSKFKGEGDKPAEANSADPPEELPALPGKGEAKDQNPEGEQPAEGGDKAAPAEGGDKAAPAEGGDKAAPADGAKPAGSDDDKYKQALESVKKTSEEFKKGIKQMGNGNEKLAPDELPPLEENDDGKVDSGESSQSETKIETDGAAQKNEQQSSPAGIDDSQSLFFSDLISRFHQKDKNAEKELLSAASGEVVSQLKTHWKTEKQQQNIAVVESQIISSMEPLKSLEREWRMLRSEIDSTHAALKDKEQLLKQKEKDIIERTSELKKLLQQKNKLLQHHSKTTKKESE